MGDAFAQISLHGGQVLSWKTEKGDELLFTSAKVHKNFAFLQQFWKLLPKISSVFLFQANSKPPHPVRGGIPICFPQVHCNGVPLDMNFLGFDLFSYKNCLFFQKKVWNSRIT